MKKAWLWLVLITFLLGLATACGRESVSEYSWNLPADFPPPQVPEDNPMSAEKVALGRALFFDKDLSANKSQSCESCHQQQFAFAENRVVSVGSSGESHRRNAPTLTNVAYNHTFTWAHPELKSLERQILLPLFGEAPIEMNVSGNEELILQRFAGSPEYVQLFKNAFPRQGKPINFDNIVKALASFVRTLISFDSPFDAYAWRGDDSALNDSELRGMALFMSEELECRHCHGGFNFSLSSVHANSGLSLDEFHNTGLYNPAAGVRYDEGVFELTGEDAHRGLFRPPTLRNVAFTAPYMHDGSIATLEGVIDFYAAGGRQINGGKLAGDGRLHVNKSAFMHGFTLNEEEKQDLLGFLHSLSDDDFVGRISQ